MEWSSDQILILIELYRNETCLWDPRDSEYKVKNKKNYAWAKTGKLMKCRVEKAKKKIDSLLSSFRRERQKQVKSEAGADEVYRSSWFALNHV